MYIECNPIYYFKIEKLCNSDLILEYVIYTDDIAQDSFVLEIWTP